MSDKQETLMFCSDCNSWVMEPGNYNARRGVFLCGVCGSDLQEWTAVPAAELAALRAERDAYAKAYAALWSKHGDLAEPTLKEVLAAALAEKPEAEK